MPTHELIIRNGTIVTPTGVDRADIAVRGEKIVEIGPEIAGSTTAEIDANGLHVLPAVIDAHVHFNEPGRADWEGWATGTRAVAAGGGAVCCEMPLNAHPPTLDAASFDAKRAAAEAAAITDFALWGGLTPDNLDKLAELAERGVIGFKAFLSNSGIDDFPAVDDFTLYEGMKRAAQLGLPVAVHAENDAITAGLMAQATRAGRTGVRDYLASRPAIAEIEAISRAVLFAGETGCALHLVHVSTGRGVELISEARARGIDVSCETCPHYLALTEDDVERLGPVAKCAPPIRDKAEREALWGHLRSGALPMVASDHSPAPPAMKSGRDFFRVWGGIAGCQTLLPILLCDGYHERALPLESIAQSTASFVARRFRLPGKGQITVGNDADLAIVDLNAQAILTAEQLLDRHRQSPFIGRTFRGRIVRTLVRGRTVFHNGTISAVPAGRLLRPAPRASIS